MSIVSDMEAEIAQAIADFQAQEPGASAALSTQFSAVLIAKVLAAGLKALVLKT